MLLTLQNYNVFSKQPFSYVTFLFNFVSKTKKGDCIGWCSPLSLLFITYNNLTFSLLLWHQSDSLGLYYWCELYCYKIQNNHKTNTFKLLILLSFRVQRYNCVRTQTSFQGKICKRDASSWRISKEHYRRRLPKRYPTPNIRLLGYWKSYRL